jgi:hypothetical protein
MKKHGYLLQIILIFERKYKACGAYG